MKSFKLLSFVSSIALAGLVSIHAEPARAAQAVSAPAIESSLHDQAAVPVYYYYHGRRYPYRYNGMYFNHRYYRGGRYRYY